LTIGALWTYWLFVRTRQHAPRAELSHTAVFWEISSAKTYVGITVVIKNVGEVSISLASAEVTVQQLEPWPSPLPTKLCIPEVSSPNALPTSGEFAWPRVGICTVDLAGCHIEPNEHHALQFNFAPEVALKTIHVYSHVENVNVKRRGKSVPVGWSWRSMHFFKRGEANVPAVEATTLPAPAACNKTSTAG